MSSTLQAIQNLPLFLWETATNPNPTWMDIATIVAATGIFWAIFITLGRQAILPLIAGKPWLQKVAKREYHTSAKKMHEDLGMPKTEEEFSEHFYQLWPWLMLVRLQHFVGGLLCLPAVANLWPESPQLASSLACLAILSEVGWEIGDIIGWIYQRYCTKGGDKEVPLVMIVLLSLHHSLATGVGVPMVMYYRDSIFLHWMCFDLQFAAAVGGFIAEYTKLLDVSKPGQLLQFQVLSFIALVVAVATRVFHYVYLCFQVLSLLFEGKEWGMLAGAGLVATLFGLFSLVVLVIPSYMRFVKFLRISNSHKNLPTDATPEQRRNSLVLLDTAAADLRKSRGVIREEILLSLFDKESSSRRNSLPARIHWTSSQGNTMMHGVIARFSMNDSPGKRLRSSFVAHLGALKEE